MVLPASAVVAPSFCSHFTSPFPHPCPVFPNRWGVCPGNEDLPALLGATPDGTLLPGGALGLCSPFRLLRVPCCSWLSSLPRLASRRTFPRAPRAGSANKLIGTPSISTFLVTLWNRQGKMRETRCLKVPEISEALQGSFKTVSLLFDSRLPSPTRPSDTLVLTLIWNLANGNLGWLVRCYWSAFSVFWILLS